jgi:hypothetical protein
MPLENLTPGMQNSERMRDFNERLNSLEKRIGKLEKKAKSKKIVKTKKEGKKNGSN